MNKIAALLLLCGAASTHAAPFSEGDPQTGKKLFDQYNCNNCHKEKVGGDGSKLTSPQKMLEQMITCSGAIGKNLTQQEQQHLGAYLNQNYYKFKGAL